MPEASVEQRPHASVGRAVGMPLDAFDDVRRVAGEANRAGFQFVCYPLGGYARTTFVPTSADAPSSPPAISLCDLQLKPDNWSQFVAGVVSPWIDLDSADERLAALSAAALAEEFGHAAFLGVKAVIVRWRAASFARLAAFVYEQLWLVGQSFRVWIVVSTGGDGDGETTETWLAWRNFRSAVRNHKLLGVCLKLTVDLDDEFVEPERFGRWIGEPLVALWVDTCLYVSAPSGALELAHGHRCFMRNIFERVVHQAPQVVISGFEDAEPIALAAYREAIEPVADVRNCQLPDFAVGFEDFLQVPIVYVAGARNGAMVQTPLQPLSDNLDSCTYSVFEKDPVKYVEYGKAIGAALVDIAARRPDAVELVVMVLGAGRGPLVAKALEAESQLRHLADDPLAGVRVRLVAVEKNPSAAVTLRSRNRAEWAERVDVVCGDMRDVRLTGLADLVVSELLGSFGDNELSPECLDGALHLMRDDCVSIPSRYRSHLGPVHSVKLYNYVWEQHSSPWLRPRDDGARRSRSADSCVSADADCDGGGGDSSVRFDQPFVVRLQSCHAVAEPQPLFEFAHPNWARATNERDATLHFSVENDCDVMGLAGYFDCQLYKHIWISILPSTHSDGMFSWFPLLLPLRQPLLARRGQTLSVRVRRRVSDTAVWYEWNLDSPHVTDIQNKNGASYKMFLK